MTFCQVFRYSVILDVAVVPPPPITSRDTALIQKIGLKQNISLDKCLSEISNRQPGILSKCL